MPHSTSALTLTDAAELAALRRRIHEESGFVWMPTEQEMIETLTTSSTFEAARQTWGLRSEHWQVQRMWSESYRPKRSRR